VAGGSSKAVVASDKAAAGNKAAAAGDKAAAMGGRCARPGPRGGKQSAPLHPDLSAVATLAQQHHDKLLPQKGAPGLNLASSLFLLDGT
jgi:hypothetical protein